MRLFSLRTDRLQLDLYSCSESSPWGMTVAFSKLRSILDLTSKARITGCAVFYWDHILSRSRQNVWNDAIEWLSEMSGRLFKTWANWSKLWVSLESISISWNVNEVNILSSSIETFYSTVPRSSRTWVFSWLSSFRLTELGTHRSMPNMTLTSPASSLSYTANTNTASSNLFMEAIMEEPRTSSPPSSWS